MRISRRKEILAGAIVLAILGLSMFLLAKAATSQAYYPRQGCTYTNQIEICTTTNAATGMCTNFECRNVDELARVRGLTNTGVNKIETVKWVVEDIVGWIQIFFYIVATLMIILAAWSYLTAGGDETKVAGAKNKVLYALIAIAIAVIAGGVVTLVKNFVG